MEHEDRIYRALSHIINLLEKQDMATAAELSTAVATLTTAVQALETELGTPAAPSVPESELDPVIAQLTAITQVLEGLAKPPA